MATKCALTMYGGNIGTTTGFVAGAGSKHLTLYGNGPSAYTWSVPTVGGGANIVMKDASSLDSYWYSDPLKAVTISGTVTFNLYGYESNMSANARFRVLVQRCGSTGTVISTIVDSTMGSELGTSLGVENWTATATSTTLSDGDRIRVVVYATNSGTMAAGYTVYMSAWGPAGSTGDSYVQFTQDLEPYGTRFFPVNVDPSFAVTGAYTEKSLSLSRGSGVQTLSVTTTASAFMGFQENSESVVFLSSPLQAFSGTIGLRYYYWGMESNAAANAIIAAGLTKVSPDGTRSAIGSGSASVPTTTQDFFETGTVNQMVTYGLNANVVLSDGDRICLTIGINATQTAGNLGAGYTVSAYYGGNTAYASGDTSVVLLAALQEYVPPVTTNIDSVDGVPYANIGSVDGVAKANIGSVDVVS